MEEASGVGGMSVVHLLIIRLCRFASSITAVCRGSAAVERRWDRQCSVDLVFWPPLKRSRKEDILFGGGAFASFIASLFMVVLVDDEKM